MKRLEQHQQNMSTVGSNTDSEFRQLFQELYSEIRHKMEKHDNKICYWDNCNVDSEFDTPDLLMKHVKDIHLTTVSGVASGPAVPPGGTRNFKKIMRKCFIVKPN